MYNRQTEQRSQGNEYIHKNGTIYLNFKIKMETSNVCHEIKQIIESYLYLSQSFETCMLYDIACIYEKYFFPGNPNYPVASFESYISKLNLKCEELSQRPKDFVFEGDNIWYNSPIVFLALGTFSDSLH